MLIENGIFKPSGVIQLRGGTCEALRTVNPLPLSRELMIEIDTGRVKVGDGVRNWNELPYVSGAEATYSKRLTAQDISNKRVELPSEYGANEIVSVTLNGLEAVHGEDYNVDGGVVSWNGLGLDGLVQAGDRLTLKYK